MKAITCVAVLAGVVCMAGGAARADMVWTDLISLIDVQRDALSGTWEKRGSELWTGGNVRHGPTVKLQVPYQAGQEYTLRTEFTMDSDDCLVFVVPFHDKPAAIFLNSYEHESGFGRNLQVIEYSLDAATRYLLQVDVGLNDISVSMGGQFVMAYYSDGMDAGISSTDHIPLAADKFGLSVYNTPVSYHSLQVMEIPEPATLALLAFGGLSLARRKRRQCPPA